MRHFIVTESHLHLLSAAVIDYQTEPEWGGFRIDPKRPFGGSDMIEQAAKLIGIKPFDDDNPDFPTYPRGTCAKIEKLYTSLAIALECQLRTRWEGIGVYEADDYKSNWKRVGN